MNTDAADVKAERERPVPFEIVALFDDEPISIDGVSLVELQEAFFIEHGESLYCCPMAATDKPEAYFYIAGDAGKERRSNASSFIAGYLSATDTMRRAARKLRGET